MNEHSLNFYHMLKSLSSYFSQLFQEIICYKMLILKAINWLYRTLALNET